MEFEAQLNELKKGSRLCSLPEISAPPRPPLPVMLPIPPLGSCSYSPYGSLPPPRTPTPTGRVTPQLEESVTRWLSAPQHLKAYERILERLNMMFPHYNRMLLNKFIQEVRSSNGGSLDMLTYDDVINRVAQLILDHQENTRDYMRIRGRSGPASDSSITLTHAWKNVSEKHHNVALALNVEDPCIICHEDMSPAEICVLDCRHSFHQECIKSWLKEQSTCPTCREHALLPEDFPLLPGRQRKSHAVAAAFH